MSGVQDIQTRSKCPQASVGVAGAYATGDVVGNSAAGPVQFSQASGPARTGVIQSVTVYDKDLQSLALDVVFFNSNPSNSTLTDNGAFNLNDADAAKVIGAVSIAATDYVASSAGSVATKTGVGLVFELSGSETLYAAVVSRGAPTYSLNGLVITVGTLQD